MFGSSSNNLFGSTTGSGLFGGQNQTQQQKPSLFGGAQTSQPSAGLFGTPNTGSSLFSQNTTQPQQQTTGFVTGQQTLFGTQPTVVGTTIKFTPITATDTMLKNGMTNNINTRNMCITAMKEYQGKSLEELRIEDYIAGRKSGQTTSLFGQQQPQAQTGGGLFKAQDTGIAGGSLFGGISAFGNKPTATTQSSGLFTSKPSIFGNLNSTAAPVSSSGGFFGGQTQSQQSKPSLFNTAPTSQPNAGGLFGQNTGGSLFSQGTAQSQQQQTPAFTGAFTAQPTAFGGFKAATTTQSTLFMNKSFVTNTAPTGGGIFGVQTQTQPAQPLSLFASQTQTSQPNLMFGGQNAGSTLFQNTNQQASTLPTAGGMFNTPGSGLFQPQPAANITPVQQVTTGIALSSRARHDIIEAQLAALPYGDSPLLKPSLKSESSNNSPKDTSSKRSFPRFLAATSTTTSTGSPIMSITATSQSTTSTLVNSRPKSTNDTLDTSSLMNSSASNKNVISLPSVSFGAALGIGSSLNNSTDDTLLKNRSYLSQDTFDTSKKSNNTFGSNASNRTMSGRKAKALDVSILNRDVDHNLSYVVENVTPRQESPVRSPDSIPSTPATSFMPSLPASGSRSSTPAIGSKSSTPATNHSSPPPTAISVPPTTTVVSIQSPTTTTATVQNSSATVTMSSMSLISTVLQSPAAPARLHSSDEDFFTDPPMEELRALRTSTGIHPILDGLTIGRKGHGSIHWPGSFKLDNIDFYNAVHFRPKEVVVYPDEAKKPAVGQGLNRPARVTLEQIWPLNHNKEIINKPQDLIRLRFREKLIKLCHRMDADFCDYIPTTGTWVFDVKHFSRYGYFDDDDESYETETIRQNKLFIQEQMTTIKKMFRSGCRASFDKNLSLISTNQSDEFHISVGTRRLKLAARIEEYINRYLSERNRIDELDDLKKTEIFRMDPPSTFLKLIDSYILELHRDNDPNIEIKLSSLCDSLLMPLSPSQGIDQRIHFGHWLRKILHSDDYMSVSKNKFAQIYEYLLRGAVCKAFECARNARLYDLAMLISMYVTPPGIVVQQHVANQLNFQQKCGGKFIDSVYYERILQLLCGAWLPSKDDNITWMNLLGVIIWYHATPSASLADCVDLHHSKYK